MIGIQIRIQEFVFTYFNVKQELTAMRNPFNIMDCGENRYQKNLNMSWDDSLDQLAWSGLLHDLSAFSSAK